MADQNEVEDLRARLAALEGDRPVPEQKPRGCLIAVLFVVIAIASIYSLAGKDRPSTVPPTAERPCSATVARLRLGQAQADGTVQATDFADSSLIVIVRPGRFALMDYSEQRNLAAAIDCGVAGAGSHLSAVRFRTSLHGSDLASFEAIDLLRARSDGLPN